MNHVILKDETQKHIEYPDKGIIFQQNTISKQRRLPLSPFQQLCLDQRQKYDGQECVHLISANLTYEEMQH